MSAVPSTSSWLCYKAQHSYSHQPALSCGAGLAKLLPGTAEQRDALMKETIPLKRVGSKWDIAMAVVFLSSPAAAYITGATVVQFAMDPALSCY